MFINTTKDGHITENQAIEGIKKLMLIGKRFQCDSILKDGFQ